MRLISILPFLLLPVVSRAADPEIQASLNRLFLLRDVHHALVCKRAPFVDIASQERDVRTVKIRTEIGRIMITSGFDTPTLMKVNEAMRGMSDCRTKEERARDARRARFWNPVQQGLLYCLPQEERIARLLAEIDPGAAYRDQVTEFIRHFEAKKEASEPGIFKRLCKESKQHKGS